MTCFAAADPGGQSGRVVLGRVHRDRLRYREVHRATGLPVVAGPAEATSIGNLLEPAC